MMLARRFARVGHRWRVCAVDSDASPRRILARRFGTLGGSWRVCSVDCDDVVCTIATGSVFSSAAVRRRSSARNSARSVESENALAGMGVNETSSRYKRISPPTSSTDRMPLQPTNDSLFELRARRPPSSIVIRWLPLRLVSAIAIERNNRCCQAIRDQSDTTKSAKTKKANRCRDPL